MRRIKVAILVLVIAAITGCAHPFVISPDISTINAPAATKRIDKSVGYYISPAERNKAVITPGGGGDKVKYYPYKDIETGFYKMLTNVFTKVTVLKSPTDQGALTSAGIQYVIVPTITTDSSSSSLMTWPPTDVTVNLKCDVSDAKGNAVASALVTGTGHAEFSEFKSDFSLSGERASQDALIKMQQKLLDIPELRK